MNEINWQLQQADMPSVNDRQILFATQRLQFVSFVRIAKCHQQTDSWCQDKFSSAAMIGVNRVSIRGLHFPCIQSRMNVTQCDIISKLFGCHCWHAAPTVVQFSRAGHCTVRTASSFSDWTPAVLHKYTYTLTDYSCEQKSKHTSECNAGLLLGTGQITMPLQIKEILGVCKQYRCSFYYTQSRLLCHSYQGSCVAKGASFQTKSSVVISMEIWDVQPFSPYHCNSLQTHVHCMLLYH